MIGIALSENYYTWHLKELFDCIAPQNVENGTVDNSLP